MKELVVISGKGGTGKTSVVAAFAALAEGAVLADCDVDAADLHLILQPEILERHTFTAGHEARIRQADCIQCGACLARCRFEAVQRDGGGAGEAVFTIDPLACEGCGVCVHACPVDAIDFPEVECGEWYVSKTRFGSLAHARLAAAAENSGKLVTMVRNAAKAQAEKEGGACVLIDGSPGIGCPVIASITSASLVLAVAEPTQSGLHDLERVLQLARQLRVPACVCVNKWDINPEMTGRITAICEEQGVKVAGRVPYDRVVTEAQVAAQSVIEFSDGSVAQALRSLWAQVRAAL